MYIILHASLVLHDAKIGCPAGAPYLPLLAGWRALFPGVRPIPLVASVIFFAPIIRDFVAWCGVRQVRLSAPCRALIC